MKNLIQDTLGQIKKEHIAPEPRWKFLVRKFGAWAVLGVILLLGAAAIAIIYYLISQLDWEVPSFMHQSTFVYGLSVFPYIWVVLIGLVIVAAFFGVRKTETGYRYNSVRIATVAIGVVVVAGIALAASNFGGKMNNALVDEFPAYGHMVTTKQSQWSQPQNGLLSGTIEKVQGNSISLQDFQGKKWEVQIDSKTFIAPVVSIQPGEVIKLVGTDMGKSIFQVQEIRPWGGMGMGNGGGGNGGTMMNGDSSTVNGNRNNPADSTINSSPMRGSGGGMMGR